MSIEELMKRYRGVPYRDIITELEALRAMLRRFEWHVVSTEPPVLRQCEECGGWDYAGHEPDCALAALLGNAQTAPATPGGVPDVRGREGE